MFKRIVVLCALGLVTVAGAHASTLLPGTSVSASPLGYGGTNLYFVGGTLAFGGSTANYAANVYRDPSNVFCSGCLDFAFIVDNQSDTDIFESFSVAKFPGTIAVGYSTADGGNAAPTLISSTLNGTITFDFAAAGGAGLLPHHVSDALVIQTSDLSGFGLGTLSLTDAAGLTAPGIGLNPIPEPSTLVLFGSGVAGLLGAARRRFLA